MQTPDEVGAMLRLKGLGWGIKRIAKELGCSHMTVRHYVAQGGWLPYRGGRRRRALAGLEDWLAECFRRHAGNGDVVRQELAAEKGIKLSLRTVEREVARSGYHHRFRHRQELVPDARCRRARQYRPRRPHQAREAVLCEHLAVGLAGIDRPADRLGSGAVTVLSQDEIAFHTLP